MFTTFDEFRVITCAEYFALILCGGGRELHDFYGRAVAAEARGKLREQMEVACK